MKSVFRTILDREIHTLEWGTPGAAPVLMVHGLTRNAHDFDDLAAAMAPGRHIVCVDMVGRGLSQWSPEPDAEYCLAFYAQLMTGLVDALGWSRFDWVGTSMGGGIGIVAASGPLSRRIDRLVLNDIGPELAQAAVDRIRAYSGAPPRFRTFGELEAFFRAAYVPFGWISDDGWKRLVESSCRRTDDGWFTPGYDPAITRAFATHPNDFVLWDRYDAITAPVLLLRGADSDLLTPETAAAMTQRGPHCRRIDIAGCGHAPALNVPAQIDPVAAFLAVA